MPKSYTNDYCIPTDFNFDATDEEILCIANTVASKDYKADVNSINSIIRYAASFEYTGLNYSTKVYIN